jgi:amino acid transporter
MSNGHFLRVIRRKEVFALAFGAMIGWSWVALTGNWIAVAGSLGAIIAFLIGGVVVIFVGLTYAELASAMPQAGGEHVYSYRALGRTASFVCTWAILLGYVSVVAFEAVALPTVTDYLFPGFSKIYLWTIAGWDVYLTWVLVGVIAAIAVTAINILGIRTAARVQVLATALILLVGLLLVGGGAAAGDAEAMQPLFMGGTTGLLSVLIMVPFMFVGFDVIPQSAEEVDIPFSEIGKLLILAIAVAVVWYVGMIWSVSVGLTAAEREASGLPTADAMAALFGGKWAGQLLVVGGIGGILTSWNAFLIGGSRAIYALARAGQLPASLGALHPRFRTPHRALILIGALSVLAPLFGRPALVWLVDAGGLGIIVAYAFVAGSFLVLRRREPGMARPYRLHNGVLIGRLALVLSMALALLYLPGSPAALVWPQEWAIVAGWIVFGAILMKLGSGEAGRH